MPTASSASARRTKNAPSHWSEGHEDKDYFLCDALSFVVMEPGRTDDALGIGGLLTDAAWLAEIVLCRGADHRPLLRRLPVDAVASLQALARTPSLALAADQRLAFRELGLAIGLHGIESRLGLLSSERDLVPAVAALAPHLPLAGRIEAFWADPASRRGVE